MRYKNKKIILIQRLLIWIIYIFSGFILYSKKNYLIPYLSTFSKVIYPLSIFWLQIRLRKRGNWLPINSSMQTSQLWFNILPVFASFLTVITTLLNLLLFILDQFI